MVINVVNLDKAIRKYSNLENVDFKPYIEHATQLVQRTAKGLAPVSIGRGIQADPKVTERGNKVKNHSGGHLRRNIKRQTVRVGKIGVIGRVYNTVEYAPYQEFGTSKMRPQPFMYPAMQIHRKDIIEGLRAMFGKHIVKSIK